MIGKVITGGQTGADQGALRAAKAAGIPTGGYVPQGWKTETGPAPWLADFGLVELASLSYAWRTKQCVALADGLVWFGNPHSPGGRCTAKACIDLAVPWFVAVGITKPREIANWIRGELVEGSERPVVLMVAGNRESKTPGIGAKVEKYMSEVFKILSTEG